MRASFRAREWETREPSSNAAATRSSASTSPEVLAGKEETSKQEVQSIDLDEPEYTVLLKRLEEDEVARHAKVAVAEDDTGDAEAVVKADYVSPSTLSDDEPIPSTNSRSWRRKTNKRYTNTYFLFGGEHHAE